MKKVKKEHQHKYEIVKYISDRGWFDQIYPDKVILVCKCGDVKTKYVGF